MKVVDSKKENEKTKTNCDLNLDFEKESQDIKGTRWMPRCQEARKDVVGCEKLRGAANEH